MIAKYLRGAILILIILVALWVAYQVADSLQVLFSFQITAYQWILQTQDTLTSGQEHIQGIREHALFYLGKEPSVSTNSPELDIAMRVAMLQTKLSRIAWLLGGGIGVLVAKILFDIAFGAKKIILNVRSFVLD